MRRMAVADVKREFRSILDGAERGETTLVLRYGKPVAVIGPVGDTVQRPDLPKPKKPGGLAALAGYLADWETIEEDMAEVIAMRQTEIQRPPPDFD